MTGPLDRLRAIAGAVWDRVLDATNPDRVTCAYANDTHEPLDEEDQ